MAIFVTFHFVLLMGKVSTGNHDCSNIKFQWHKNLEQMDFMMLRNSQGIHAPLKLQMERTTASKVFLPLLFFLFVFTISYLYFGGLKCSIISRRSFS